MGMKRVLKRSWNFMKIKFVKTWKLKSSLEKIFDVVMNIIPIYIILRGRGIELHKPVTESWTLKSQNDADAADVRL